MFDYDRAIGLLSPLWMQEKPYARARTEKKWMRALKDFTDFHGKDDFADFREYLKDFSDFTMMAVILMVAIETGHHCYKKGVFDTQFTIAEIVSAINEGSEALKSKMPWHIVCDPRFDLDEINTVQKYVDWLTKTTRGVLNSFNKIKIITDKVPREFRDDVMTYLASMKEFSQKLLNYLEDKDVEKVDELLLSGPNRSTWFF